MKLELAEKMVNEKIAEYGLTGYYFQWSNTKNVFGDHNSFFKRIRLSKPLTLINDEDKVKLTVLHEIAHALTPGQNHNETWKAKCIEIGGDGKRCKTDANFIEPKYGVKCNNCKKIVKKGFRQTSLAGKYHSQCGNLYGGSLQWVELYLKVGV